MSDVQKFGEEFQRVGKDGFDAAVHSFGEVNKGLHNSIGLKWDQDRPHAGGATLALLAQVTHLEGDPRASDDCRR